MHPKLHHQLADRVWEQTLPALRRRRARRRALAGTAAVLTIALITLLWLPSARPLPDQPNLAGPAPLETTTLGHPSLAVLVVDSSGARFAQLRPDEITIEGLELDLTLEPVITTPNTEFY